MTEAIMQRVVDRVVAMGPMVLMQSMHPLRTTDVVEAPSLSIDDKRRSWPLGYLICML